MDILFATWFMFLIMIKGTCCKFQFLMFLYCFRGKLKIYVFLVVKLFKKWKKVKNLLNLWKIIDNIVINLINFNILMIYNIKFKKFLIFEQNSPKI